MQCDYGHRRFSGVGVGLNAVLATFEIIALVTFIVAVSVVLCWLVSMFLHDDK